MIPPPGERRPPHQREDREVPARAATRLLRRGPETRLPADGKRLVPSLPAVGGLPESEAQVQESVVHLDDEHDPDNDRPTLPAESPQASPEVTPASALEIC